MATHSLRQIRLLSHSHQNRVAHWRRTDPAFRQREAELLETRARLEKITTRAEREAEVRFPRRFRIYMDLLRKFDDRMQAADEAGLSWLEVKTGLGEHAGFSEAYGLYLEEQKVRIQDALRKKGLKGDPAALRALAHSLRDDDGEPGDDPQEGDDAADAFLSRLGAIKDIPAAPLKDDEAEADA